MSKLTNDIFKGQYHFLSSRFGSRAVISTSAGKSSSFHSGTDYSTKGKKLPQYAVTNGTVTSCGVDYSNASAKYVWVEYPSLGVRMMHYHLDSISVTNGQKVKRGTQVGITGKTGLATGIHLHLGIKKIGYGEWLDAEQWSANVYSKLKLSDDDDDASDTSSTPSTGKTATKGTTVPTGTGSSSFKTTKNGTAYKGLSIQAVILRQNWKEDGKDDMLDCGQFELDDVQVTGPPSTVTIKGTSLFYSSTVRQTKKSKSWEKYDLKGIASEIARKNGMVCMFESDDNPSYKRIEQYKETDISFLQRLCKKAGCSLKITNNIIVVFEKRKYEKKKVVATFEKGATTYTKYSLKTGSNNTFTSCKVSWTTAKGKVISGTAYIDGYDKDADNNQCLKVKQKVSSVSEAKSVAERLLRERNKYERTANFTVPGNPKLLAGCTVRLKKFGPWDGKYIISQAKHTVSGSGYTTQIELRRVS